MAINIPSDKRDTVLSLLCGPELWHWDSGASCSISFNENGTGLLRAGAEISVFIAAEFDWKVKSPESLEYAIEFSNQNSRKCTPISSFDIELTLTTRVHPLLQETRNGHTLVNEQALTAAAFLPKAYTIRLEYGRFDEPAASWIDSRPFLYRAPKYALRLVFDKSPFPPKKEWNEEGKFPAEQGGFWHIKEFASREVSKDSWLMALVYKKWF